MFSCFELVEQPMHVADTTKGFPQSVNTHTHRGGGGGAVKLRAASQSRRCLQKAHTEGLIDAVDAMQEASQYRNTGAEDVRASDTENTACGSDELTHLLSHSRCP